MNTHLPKPIFTKKLTRIKWLKIYSREYGVQYSEMAILCLSPKAKYHIPSPSTHQIVIPDDNNTSFYIDSESWNRLVTSLNENYTNNIYKLQIYENQFSFDAENYLRYAKELSGINFRNKSNFDLSLYFKNYQGKLFRYSVFAWTSFILNNYVSERATTVIDKYIIKNKKSAIRQNILNSLFKPEKKAAVLLLQEETALLHGKHTGPAFDKLFEKYKWMSCLDIHNKPWTKKEFKKHISGKQPTVVVKPESLDKYKSEFRITNSDYKYLLIAKRFVYIKDARDDFRRQGVYLAGKFFQEIAKRLHIDVSELSLLQETEVINWLENNISVDKKIIHERKKGFVLYLDKQNNLTCLSGKILPSVLQQFNFFQKEEKQMQLQGTVAAKGTAKGSVVIVNGIGDLPKVQNGQILVAVSTHPDYVPAMKKAIAIITDEGGITSHAAIVAREFGIPCIVGTRNATKTLKDGDLVELDGNNGFITILK